MFVERVHEETDAEVYLGLIPAVHESPLKLRSSPVVVHELRGFVQWVFELPGYILRWHLADGKYAGYEAW